MRPVTRLLACATAVALIAALTSSTAQLQNRNSVLTLAAGDRSSLSELREADSLVDQLGRDGALRLAASERGSASITTGCRSSAPRSPARRRVG